MAWNAGHGFVMDICVLWFLEEIKETLYDVAGIYAIIIQSITNDHFVVHVLKYMFCLSEVLNSLLRTCSHDGVNNVITAKWESF